MRRILSLPKYCKENHLRQKRKRLSKEEKKQLKDDKEKVTKRHVKIVSKLAKRFSRIVANNETIVIPHVEEMVNLIINLCCINESQRRKLLSTNNLNIAGDGSKLGTQKRYGKKICQCLKRNCDCPRFYNDKDASIGYDAYHDTFIQLSSFSLQNNYELPIYLMMATGGRHDAWQCLPCTDPLRFSDTR